MFRPAALLIPIDGFAFRGSVDGSLEGLLPLVCRLAIKEWTVYKLPVVLHHSLRSCLHLRLPAHSFGALETAHARVEWTRDGSPSQHCLQIAQRLLTLMQRLESSCRALCAGSNGDSRQTRVSNCPSPKNTTTELRLRVCTRCWSLAPPCA